MKVFFLNRETTGIDYRSAYIIKLDTGCIIIDWIHNEPRENTINCIKQGKNDVTISDKQLLEIGAVEVKEANMQHDLIAAYFLAMRK